MASGLYRLLGLSLIHVCMAIFWRNLAAAAIMNTLENMAL